MKNKKNLARAEGRLVWMDLLFETNLQSLPYEILSTKLTNTRQIYLLA